jgi:hypothetical protein
MPQFLGCRKGGWIEAARQIDDTFPADMGCISKTSEGLGMIQIELEAIITAVTINPVFL